MGHTHGPWEIHHYGDNEGDIHGSDGTLVCMMRAGDTAPAEDWESDARLIAAAPELLAACEELLIYLSDWDDDESETCVRARAAIAKAEGRE
jgi:hypothetical protein